MKKEEVEVNYLDWMAEYHTKYTKSEGNRTVFIDFLIGPKMKLLPEKIRGDMPKKEKEAIEKKNNAKAALREQKAKSLKVKPEQLTKDLMKSFTEYLINRFTGEGTPRFKKMILAAVKKDIIRKNPCTGVSIKKDILSQEEISKLAATDYRHPLCIHLLPVLQSSLVRCKRPLLRQCRLFKQNAEVRAKQDQSPRAVSGVVILLNNGLLALTGQPKDGNRQQIIFPHPSHTICLKALRHRIAKVDIEKHILACSPPQL